MGCLRVLAFIAGGFLLLPGLCFLAVGFADSRHVETVAVNIGLFILLVAALLIGGGVAMQSHRSQPPEDTDTKSES
jgi:hypothetical protein